MPSYVGYVLCMFLLMPSIKLWLVYVMARLSHGADCACHYYSREVLVGDLEVTKKVVLILIIMGVLQGYNNATMILVQSLRIGCQLSSFSKLRKDRYVSFLRRI